jgi:hypothetical protein
MGLISSIKRWNSIVFNLKRDRKKIDDNQGNIRRLAVNRFPNLVSAELDYKTRMAKREAKVYSQNGEDGILMYILDSIGIDSFSIMEIGIGNGSECNSRNLIENFGWNAWMVDGSVSNVNQANALYKNQIKAGNVNIQHSWVTKENIEDTIHKISVPKNVDILSIDIDGNDYWIWESINSILPRVVIIEYNASFGSERSVTIPYDPDFERFKKHKSGYYHGASLKALEKLGKQKGYSLICCDSTGSNAIFIRKELDNSKQVFDAHSSDTLYYPLKKRMETMSLKDQYNQIIHLKVINI